MTELEHIEIEGFKGLESVAFEPSQINLITGRNNTGKTSLLEAIDLLFRTSDVTKFGSDFKHIINKRHGEARVKSGERSLNIRAPGESEAISIFIDGCLDLVQSQGQYLYNIGRRGDTIDREIFDDILTSVLRRNLRDEAAASNISKIKDKMLVFEIDGEAHPYLLLGEDGNEALSRSLKRSRDELVDEIIEHRDMLIQREENNPDAEERFDELSIIESAVNDAIHQPFAGVNQGTFIKRPDNNEGLRFMESIQLAEGVRKQDDEKDALKIDNIGDYIREHDLVDGLKTFDLDYLIFENEDGSKYDIPYDFMGDGFKAIVGLLWELLDNDVENEIVLLEEPENHMHPGYIRQVVYFLIHLAREEDVQLFITTHNSDFINDFFNENLTEGQREYLEEEFSLIRMEEDTAQVLDYETAESDLKDLHLDLRGI
jgi:AAA15 family ATPase/GTPase